MLHLEAVHKLQGSIRRISCTSLTAPQSTLQLVPCYAVLASMLGHAPAFENHSLYYIALTTIGCLIGDG